jgi:hypothetical protein
MKGHHGGRGKFVKHLRQKYAHLSKCMKVTFYWVICAGILVVKLVGILVSKVVSKDLEFLTTKVGTIYHRVTQGLSVCSKTYWLHTRKPTYKLLK